MLINTFKVMDDSAYIGAIPARGTSRTCTYVGKSVETSRTSGASGGCYYFKFSYELDNDNLRGFRALTSLIMDRGNR